MEFQRRDHAEAGAGTGLAIVGSPCGLPDPVTEDPVVEDPVVVAVNAALRLAEAQPGRPCSLFISSIRAAIATHLALHDHRGVDAVVPRLPRLTRWQERRAKEFLVRSAADEVSIAAAATACRLSRSYFIRAFKNSTGETPHR